MPSPAKIFLLTSIAMSAFAANSLLCRIALKHTGIDPASFTTIRIVSGALMLWLIARSRDNTAVATATGNWLSALALFIYAAAFSFAYITLSAATGALLLFGAVQATMIGYGIRSGQSIGQRQIAGLALACVGLVILVLPGLSAPSLSGALLMLLAGVAWAVYSLRARGAGDPLLTTAGNFLRAVPLALLLLLIVGLASGSRIDPQGVALATASGALASGVGYAIWYAALRGLQPGSAATVQLSVPLLAALGGMLFLGEPLTPRFGFAAVAILGGIALFLMTLRRPK